MLNWKNYTGREVVVHARGVVYEGVLVEMTETSIALRSVLGYREVPMDGVTKVEPKGASSSGGLLSPSPLAGLDK